jgi:hypothetical protein
VIHAVRKLARGIHRRSVWQILVVYLGGAWAALFGIARLTALTGLPSWTPTLALVLLVALLPLIVATAVVQGGLPGLRIVDEVDPNELIGRTPDEVLVIPEAHPLHGAGLFTWRNTVLGGVSAAALLVTSVVAYLSMWALGIGPVGSLLAQGVIEERDPVELHAFENLTDDPTVGAIVTDVFELDLVRSRVVTLADRGAPGARLVLSGDIIRRGDGYLLTSRVATPGGSVVARLAEDADGDDDLAAAVELLSERVRERLGESLRTIREGSRLAPIATDSTAAFRLYREAERANLAGDVRGAIELTEQAVRADPGFALGWRRLGTLREGAADRAGARAAYQAVVDLWGPGGAAERTVREMRERIAVLE